MKSNNSELIQADDLVSLDNSGIAHLSAFKKEILKSGASIFLQFLNDNKYVPYAISWRDILPLMTYIAPSIFYCGLPEIKDAPAPVDTNINLLGKYSKLLFRLNDLKLFPDSKEAFNSTVIFWNNMTIFNNLNSTGSETASDQIDQSVATDHSDLNNCEFSPRGYEFHQIKEALEQDCIHLPFFSDAYYFDREQNKYQSLKIETNKNETHALNQKKFICIGGIVENVTRHGSVPHYKVNNYPVNNQNLFMLKSDLEKIRNQLMGSNVKYVYPKEENGDLDGVFIIQSQYYTQKFIEFWNYALMNKAQLEQHINSEFNEGSLEMKCKRYLEENKIPDELFDLNPYLTKKSNVNKADFVELTTIRDTLMKIWQPLVDEINQCIENELDPELKTKVEQNLTDAYYEYRTKNRLKSIRPTVNDVKKKLEASDKRLKKTHANKIANLNQVILYKPEYSKK